MAHWRKTKRPGVYVAHQLRCPARDDDDARCRCEPSWRGRRRHRITGKAEWQKPVTKDRSEVLSWLAVGKKGAAHARERARSDRTFESIGDEWLEGVRAGRISRGKGRCKPYSPTTIADYVRAYRNFLRPEFGPMPADEIGELEWQMWSDRLSRDGLSRSRISTLVAVASAIYAWAMTPTRRYVSRNRAFGPPVHNDPRCVTCSWRYLSLVKPVAAARQANPTSYTPGTATRSMLATAAKPSRSACAARSATERAGRAGRRVGQKAQAESEDPDERREVGHPHVRSRRRR